MICLCNSCIDGLCLFGFVFCWWFVVGVGCVLFVLCYVLFDMICSLAFLFVVCCWLFVVGCLLCAVFRVLFIVCVCVLV